MEDNNKANIVFNISGGNNQILPNAIKAEQNCYGDKYICLLYTSYKGIRGYDKLDYQSYDINENEKLLVAVMAKEQNRCV